MFQSDTALVVDDSFSTAQLLGQILRHELKFGNVLNAGNGRQALELLAKQPVHWIFSDIEMPELDGLALLAAVRQQPRGKDIPFIVISSHADKATIAKAMGAGATEFLAKPFTAATVIDKVRRIGPRPAAGESAPRQRRRAPRVFLAHPLACQIVFGPEVDYPSALVNLSATGCLLRAPPFTRGGTVYDPARLTLDLGGEILAVKGILRRLEATKKTANAAGRLEVLAAFEFIGLDAATLSRLKTLIVRHA